MPAVANLQHTKLTIMPVVANLQHTKISIYFLCKSEINNLNIIYHLLKGKNTHNFLKFDIQLYKFRHLKGLRCPLWVRFKKKKCCVDFDE